MKKIWLITIAVLVILFVLTVQVLAGNSQTEREEMRKAIQGFKEDNKFFCETLNTMLECLWCQSKSYQKVKKFRLKAEQAEQLISGSEKQLKEIEKEKNETVVVQTLGKINNDLIRTSLIHREILIFLVNVFGPLFGIDAIQETVI